MSKITDRTVLITGGAAGIGRLMGAEVLAAGARRLIIWDVDAASLDRCRDEFRAAGFSQVETQLVDVTDTGRVAEAAAQAGPVDVLINNAGIVVGKPFVEHSPRDIERTMAINAVAPMHVARAFLPGMIARGAGHIVNIASAAGMVANPRMSVYCASKWAVIGWSESLRLELEQARTGVRVTTVTPYYIDTGMFAGVRSPLIPILRPEVAARRIIRGVVRRARFVRMPAIVYLLPLVKGLLPAAWFDRLVGDWMGVYHSMDRFRGHDADGTSASSG